MKKVLIYIIIITFVSLISFLCLKNPTDKTITLKFSSWGSQSETIILKELIKEYEIKNKNIKIEFIHIPQNYFQKLHLLFASNTAPDVVFLNNHYIKLYAEANLLENLSNYNFDINLFYPQAIECLKINENLYAIPRDISGLVLYYNKEIFNEQNIKQTQLKSVFELRELAKKLTTKNHFGLNYEENSLYWLYFLSSNGGGLLNDSATELRITDEKSIEAINIYKAMLNIDNSMPTKAQIGSMTTAQMFINGKLAMYLGGRWMIPKFRETINFDWDVMEFPYNNKDKLYIDASGWAISKNSKNKNEAIKFINFLSSKESSEKFMKTGLIFPARLDTSTLLLENDKTQKPKNTIVFSNLIKHSKPTPISKNYNTINDIVNEKIKSVFNQNYDFETVFDKKTITKIERQLK